MKQVRIENLGLIDYKEAWEYQEKLFTKISEQKQANRNLDKADQIQSLNHLLICEHPHVYTLGKSGKFEHLLINNEQLKAKGASFYKINRGGDITYHGPGQLVVYPIFDLDQFFTDIHKYLRFLEEAVILTLKEYGISAERSTGETGVWLDIGTMNARKICAMGVRASRWITMHGLAFNLNTDLDYFTNIIPCGITDKSVTSLNIELRKQVDIKEVAQKLTGHLQDLFEFQISN
ncbi:MAG: lipoyl(octanoyl) transferase LipB [Flavobacteriales bacterium]